MKLILLKLNTVALSDTKWHLSLTAKKSEIPDLDTCVGYRSQVNLVSQLKSNQGVCEGVEKS